MLQAAGSIVLRGPPQSTSLWTILRDRWSHCCDTFQRCSPICTPRLPTAARAPAGCRNQPENTEAEQGLLGAILINNEAYGRVAEYLRAEHFDEAVHGRIFGAIGGLIERGRIADQITLRTCSSRTTRCPRSTAPSTSRGGPGGGNHPQRRAYGRPIHDLELRRGLIQVGQDIVKRRSIRSRRRAAGADRDRRERLFKLAQEGQIEGGFRPFPAALTNAVTMARRRITRKPGDRGRERLYRLDEKLGRLATLGPGDPRRPAEHGQDCAGDHDRRQRRSETRAGEVADDTHAVGVFSLEMSAEQLAMRLLSAQAELSSDDLAGASCATRLQEGRQASQDSRRGRCSSTTPRRSRSRRCAPVPGASNGGMGSALLVVDYLQLVRPTSRLAQTTGSRRSPRSPAV